MNTEDTEACDSFNHFFDEFFTQHLGPEQRADLWRSPQAIQAFKQNMIGVCNSAKAALPAKTISDMPIGIIQKCKTSLAGDTDIVKGVSTDFGLDKLKESYEGTPSEKDIVVIKMPGTTNASNAWSTAVKKLGKPKLLTQIPTPQQIDVILPHLRTLNKNEVCNYIIPVMGQKNEVALFGITIQKLEGETQPSYRNIDWSIYMTIDIGDDFPDIDTTKNDVRPNYSVILVQ
jgi:hypothetical protein